MALPGLGPRKKVALLEALATVGPSTVATCRLLATVWSDVASGKREGIRKERSVATLRPWIAAAMRIERARKPPWERRRPAGQRHSLAEICVGDAEPDTVADRIRSWGITLLDVPAAVAEPRAKAYLKYRERRREESGRDAPSVPLPDFFIGAHAQVMGWPLATADQGRFRTYFPSVPLQTP